MRIIKLSEVMHTTGLSRSTIYRKIEAKVFPQAVTLGEKSVGWVESEVHDWIHERIMERDEQPA